jgi:GTP-sensing pleiotropic transcriptional regulator CodY
LRNIFQELVKEVGLAEASEVKEEVGVTEAVVDLDAERKVGESKKISIQINVKSLEP